MQIQLSTEEGAPTRDELEETSHAIAQKIKKFVKFARYMYIQFMPKHGQYKLFWCLVDSKICIYDCSHGCSCIFLDTRYFYACFWLNFFRLEWLKF